MTSGACERLTARSIARCISVSAISRSIDRRVVAAGTFRSSRRPSPRGVARRVPSFRRGLPGLKRMYHGQAQVGRWLHPSIPSPDSTDVVSRSLLKAPPSSRLVALVGGDNHDMPARVVVEHAFKCRVFPSCGRKNDPPSRPARPTALLPRVCGAVPFHRRRRCQSHRCLRWRCSAGAALRGVVMPRSDGEPAPPPRRVPPHHRRTALGHAGPACAAGAGAGVRRAFQASTNRFVAECPDRTACKPSRSVRCGPVRSFACQPVQIARVLFERPRGAQQRAVAEQMW